MALFDRYSFLRGKEKVSNSIAGVKEKLDGLTEAGGTGGSGKQLGVVVLAGGLLVFFLVFMPSLFTGSHPARPAVESLKAVDTAGNTWVLDYVKGQKIETFTDVNTKPGPPLLVKTNVKIEGQDASIGLVIQGQAGERYVGGVVKNGTWQPAPKITIVDQQDKVLRTGQFEYG